MPLTNEWLASPQNVGDDCDDRQNEASRANDRISGILDC